MPKKDISLTEIKDIQKISYLEFKNTYSKVDVKHIAENLKEKLNIEIKYSQSKAVFYKAIKSILHIIESEGDDFYHLLLDKPYEESGKFKEYKKGVSKKLPSNVNLRLTSKKQLTRTLLSVLYLYDKRKYNFERHKIANYIASCKLEGITSSLKGNPYDM